MLAGYGNWISRWKWHLQKSLNKYLKLLFATKTVQKQGGYLRASDMASMWLPALLMGTTLEALNCFKYWSLYLNSLRKHFSQIWNTSYKKERQIGKGSPPLSNQNKTQVFLFSVGGPGLRIFGPVAEQFLNFLSMKKRRRRKNFYITLKTSSDRSARVIAEDSTLRGYTW